MRQAETDLRLWGACSGALFVFFGAALVAEVMHRGISPGLWLTALVMALACPVLGWGLQSALAMCGVRWGGPPPDQAEDYEDGP